MDKAKDHETNNRLIQQNVLLLARLRACLKPVADQIAMCDTTSEANTLLTNLVEQLLFLHSGDTQSLPWKQIARQLDGPKSYGLERIGFFPNPDEVKDADA